VVKRQLHNTLQDGQDHQCSCMNMMTKQGIVLDLSEVLIQQLKQIKGGTPYLFPRNTVSTNNKNESVVGRRDRGSCCSGGDRGGCHFEWKWIINVNSTTAGPSHVIKQSIVHCLDTILCPNWYILYMHLNDQQRYVKKKTVKMVFHGCLAPKKLLTKKGGLQIVHKSRN
jgi:hypothetical protein